MITTLLLAAALAVNFDETTGALRPELHSSGFGPQICSCPQESIDMIKSMGFKSARTHDWALLNANERVCDYFHIFPLMHLDAKDPKNYVFGPTDYLLKRTREETGTDIFYRLGTSIEHSGPKVHFNSLIPEDFEKVAETFAGTIRHYNRGWANGYKWNIQYWELWNEPDGHNNMWCLPDGDGSRKPNDPDYIARNQKRKELFCRFFVLCLKRLKSEFPDVKVGGPALCSMRVEYFTDLLKACKEAGVAPDFISWHHYTSNPETIFKAIRTGRKLCDNLGFKDCQLVINEWHYLGKYGFSGLRSPNPAIRSKVWDGPASHNGIDSSCFNLTVLSGFQSSKLDLGFYYGCRNTGAWGFMDEGRNLYKVYYGLKLFGDFLKNYSTMCASSSQDGLTVLAAKSGDGARKGLLVTDYRSRANEIAIEVKGVPADAKATAWVHDYTRNFESVPVSFADGKLILQKADANSAAFWVKF